MDLTVVICTYNRAQNLPDCLAHLAAQRDVVDISWEVLVVDNNSTDATAPTVERLQKNHAIAIRHTFEPKQGLSNARNCAIRESTSRYVAFIDDDILVQPGWLRALVDAFREYDCDAVGGPIVVEAPSPMPSWIRPEMMGFLGQLNFGDRPVELDGNKRYPFGGNMAFHRRVFERIGDFDPDLGRKGGGAAREELYKGEETFYFSQLAAAGGRIRYAPQASVTHRILPYQLKRRFFLTVHFNLGYKEVEKESDYFGRSLASVPLFLFAQILRAGGKYLGTTLRQGPNYSVRQLMTLSYFVGRLMGYRRKNSQRWDGGRSRKSRIIS